MLRKLRRFVQRIFQLFSGAELWLAGRLGFDLGSCVGISSLACGAMRDGENPEASQAHLVPGFQRFRDRVENTVDSFGGLVLAEASTIRNPLDHVVLVHRAAPPAIRSPASTVGLRLARSQAGAEKNIRERLAPAGRRRCQYAQWVTTASPSESGRRGAPATISGSCQMIGSGGRTRAIFRTSSTVATGMILSPDFTLSGISAKSFSFSDGMTTVASPDRRAASSFSLRPPMGSTRPRSVISPV